VRQDEAIELSNYSQKTGASDVDGAPEEIRTPDPQIRSLVLYPAELRARFSLRLGLNSPRASENMSEGLRKSALATRSGPDWQGPEGGDWPSKKQ
jgi:hypothetical protein